MGIPKYLIKHYREEILKGRGFACEYIEIKDLKGGEVLDRLFDGYLIIIDNPLKMKITITEGGVRCYSIEAHNEIDKKLIVADSSNSDGLRVLSPTKTNKL